MPQLLSTLNLQPTINYRSAFRSVKSLIMASVVKVAITQHEPVWFDLVATVDKTCRLIAEAASNGAKLITFPEVWVAGYPAWIWSVLLYTARRPH
jgi:hypothetical protein